MDGSVDGRKCRRMNRRMNELNKGKILSMWRHGFNSGRKKFGILVKL